jgi:hypothetical protein
MLTSNKGFFNSLYDLSFNRFVTPTIVSLVYLLALIGLGIWCLFFATAGMWFGYGYGGVAGVVFLTRLILAIVLFLIGSISIRVWLELVVAVIRIAENTESLRNKEA